MAVSASTIRNVALLSHSGAGKTTLAETMLFNAKVINRIGRVEDGNTVSDYEPEETRRSSSVQTSLLRISEGDDKINMLDTPGYDEFLGEAVAAIRVVESAVILVAAPTGVDVGTERAWSMAQERGLPVAFVLNKMDREKRQLRAQRSGATEHLRQPLRSVPVAGGRSPGLYRPGQRNRPARRGSGRRHQRFRRGPRAPHRSGSRIR